ncbi:Ltp family lipoprotein [Nocardioides sp. MJB4]|uniref:Ltp family lipoprotein n=1 Tax=Nocardioides donggukensis TaxID=2774019 RepID=A0A927PZ94_9ACTN|nr:Ltp family lipoprotein [Nocardioides donggukensis]
MNATPPPGWYPDNAGDGQRYWDGGQWTEHTAPSGIEPPAGGPSLASGTPGDPGAGTSQQNWFLRHKVLSGVSTFVLLLVILGALGGEADDPAPAAADTSAQAAGESDSDTAAGTATETEDEVEAEPVDSDGDGVIDEEDFAPKDRKVQTKEDVDTDKDGVADFEDAFPKNAKYAKDADEDSVPDELDDFPKDARYSQDTDGDGVADSKDAFPKDPSRSKVTFAMENALAAAQDYLDFSAFSRQGLIDQLSSEYGSDFRLEDATWAVGQLKTDWKQQAVRAAKDYLDFSPFSRQGLIDQLSSPHGSQFTVGEATFAVNKIGL